MTMMSHDEATELLGLAVAGGLSPREDRELAAHAASCAACREELDALRELASELVRLPTPMPAASVVERVRRLVHLELAGAADERLSTLVIGFLLAFSWIVTSLSVAVLRLFSGGELEIASLLGSPARPLIDMGWSAAYLATLWLGGSVVVILLALKFRKSKSRKFA